jgi:AraC-like DNA-binding protein
MAAFVRAGALSKYAEVARQLGMDPHAMLRRANLDPMLLVRPDVRVPVEAVTALLEASAERSRCPTFGLRMAEARGLSDFGAVSLLLTHQPTMRDVLATTARYRHLLNEALAMHIEDSGGLVIIREELVVANAGSVRQGRELAVGTMFRLFQALLGPNWRPYSVNFTHGAPPDAGIHRRLFGPNVEFNSEFNGIVCVSSDLDRPNPTADPAMARYARQFVETLPNTAVRSVVLEVRKAIFLLLPLGQASIESVAGEMGANVRTLQRRLEAEGAAFSDLVDGVRRDLVVRHLMNDSYSLSQVAQMLGYAQLSSFTRWFAARFGMPPVRWRVSARAAARVSDSGSVLATDTATSENS